MCTHYFAPFIVVCKNCCASGVFVVRGRKESLQCRRLIGKAESAPERGGGFNFTAGSRRLTACGSWGVKECSESIGVGRPVTENIWATSPRKKIELRKQARKGSTIRQ